MENNTHKKRGRTVWVTPAEIQAIKELAPNHTISSFVHHAIADKLEHQKWKKDQTQKIPLEVSC